MTASQTAALSFQAAVYDLEAIPPSGEADAIRLLEGNHQPFQRGHKVMEPNIVQVSETNYIVEIEDNLPAIVQVLEEEPVIQQNMEVTFNLEIASPPVNILEVTETSQPVHVSAEQVIVVQPASVGLQGPPGEVADLLATGYIAGEPLGGQRVVIVWIDGLLYYADATNLAHFNRVLGITVGAIENGASGSVRIGGFMTEPTWNWQPDKFIYLGTNGLLTQNPPATGFLLEIGQPINPTKILVDIKFPLFLA